MLQTDEIVGAKGRRQNHNHAPIFGRVGKTHTLGHLRCSGEMQEQNARGARMFQRGKLGDGRYSIEAQPRSRKELTRIDGGNARAGILYQWQSLR